MTNGDGPQARVKEDARSARTPGYLEFKAAVLEFSNAPTLATLVRYLNASRALEGLDPLPRRPVESVNGHRLAHPSR
jgi:hypothetical protein